MSFRRCLTTAALCTLALQAWCLGQAPVTLHSVSSPDGPAAADVLAVDLNNSSHLHLVNDLGYSLGRHPARFSYRPHSTRQRWMGHGKLCQSLEVDGGLSPMRYRLARARIAFSVSCMNSTHGLLDVVFKTT